MYIKITFEFSLSLYSTATQNSRVGASHWSRPPTQEFHVRDMLVSKNAKICVTPNANPQRQQVEYRSRWVPNAKFPRWPCTFLFFGVDFIHVGSSFSVNMGIMLRILCVHYFWGASNPTEPQPWLWAWPMISLIECTCISHVCLLLYEF